jgi:multidrug efflux system membrane fusion protein
MKSASRLPELSLTAAVLVLALAGCSRHEEGEKTVRPVQAQKVELASADDRSVYSGEVKARYETDLGFRIGGKVVARYVDVGATVKKGQVLARLDPNDAQLNAEAARAQMTSAQNDFEFADAELNRYKSLFEQKFISKAAFDQKQNAYNVAKAKVEQQRNQYSWSHNQSTYTSLTADADGVITAINVEVGQVVNVGQTVMKLARPEQKEVVINVPESRLGELQQASEIAVTLWALANKPYLGKVREVSPSGDPATRTYAVKVSIVNADPNVKLGMTANALVRKSASDKAVALLPLTALTEVEGAPAVWVIDPHTKQVNLRPVQVGQYRGDGVTVLSGLQREEIVVTAGVHKLLPGQQVRLYTAGGSGPERVAGRS